MGQFLEAMDKKWKSHPEAAAQYETMRPDLVKIDTLEVSLQAVMEQVYLPLQREYEITTYGAFLNAQVQLDKDGPAKLARIENDVKEKVKNYWQTIAISLQQVDASNRDAIVDGTNIRSVMRAFIPGELDNMDARKKIISFAKQYSQDPVSEEAAHVVTELQNITWQSINKAHLMLVLEAGVGGEIVSAKGLASKGSARAGGCDAAGDKLKSEFKNLPEVDRLSLVSEGMSLILAALTSIKQLRDENDIDRLEGFAPTVSANVDSVVNGNAGKVPGQPKGGMHNMLKKLYQLEMLECILTIDQRKKKLVNADLRKEIIENTFKLITRRANQFDLAEMIKLRTHALLLVRDCENENLTISEILVRNRLMNISAIMFRALSPFRYHVREAFPKLNATLCIGIASREKEPITIVQAIHHMDAVLNTNKEDIRKHYSALKTPGEALASTFGYLVNMLDVRKPGFGKVITVLEGESTKSLSIATVLERSLGFDVPEDKHALELWKAIEDDRKLQKDPLVIAIKSFREMLKLTMKLQKEAQALIAYLTEQSTCKADMSEAVALEFGRYYHDMVVAYPQNFAALNRLLFDHSNALNSIKTQTNIAQHVSSKDLAYKPTDELTRNMKEIQKMNAGQILSPEKTLAMKLALALYDFAVNEGDSFQSFANETLIELKGSSELESIAKRIQAEVDKLVKDDRSVNFFAGVKSMVGFSMSQADLTPKDKLMTAVALATAYKPSGALKN